MKKKLLVTAAAAALFSAATFDMQAQLSGLYTINSASATGGTNFINFTDFASALNTSGVSGPVTVDVVANSGPYVEQVNFTQATGISSANNVVVNGNGNTITYNSSSSTTPWTIRLEGADYMSFNELSVLGTGTYAYALLLFSGANNNSFDNCTFSVSISGSSTSQMPVVVSGSGTSYGTMGNSGSNNLWQSCTSIGGYYGISFYGASSVPYNSNNKVIDCNVLDWYSRGISHYYYQVDYIFRGNLISRPSRTNSTTAYGIYTYYNMGTIIENNRIQGFFDNIGSNTSTTYGIYAYQNYGSTPKATPIYIRNNIIADMNNNGTIYGLSAAYIDGYVYHNTISLDYTGSTGGTTYGLYVYTTAGKEMEVTNNNVSITKGGTVAKYGIYYSSTGNIVSDYNNFYVNSAGGNNNVGYYGGAQTTLANLQSATGDHANSQIINPNFTSIPLNDYTPTNVALNDLGTPLGLLTDIDNNIRNQTTPDIGAIEFLSPQCSGTPQNASLFGPTYSICPGEDVYMVLNNLVPDGGLTYQWQESTFSNVGPFTPITGANSFQYTAPSVTANTWYSVVMTCTNPGGGSASPVATVVVSGPVTGTIPYYEGFENVGLPGRLPNCSWSASDLGLTNMTYTSSQSGNRVANTGNSFAVFSNATLGSTYFYTHPIQMNVGITYSAAVQWATEYFGYSNWTDLSILVGPNQNPTGMVQVATIAPAISGPYKILGNTYTVSSSGLYYVAIMATGASGSAQFLSIDDLSITIPCDLGSPNTPTVSMSSNNSTVCAGEIVSISASGADTYSWSVGTTGPSIGEYPMTSTNFIVYGTNTLTGCVNTANQFITVNTSPTVVAIANNPISCSGSPVTISGIGADSYAWSTGQNGQNIVVNPTGTTSYTVIGVNSLGCSDTYVTQITVNQLPVVTINTSNSGEACKNDAITLSAGGTSQSYFWINSGNSQVYAGSPITVYCSATSIFTVTGTDANGCEGTSNITQAISECTGITEIKSDNLMAMYPNPTNDLVHLEFKKDGENKIEISDASGRVLMQQSVNGTTATLELHDLTNGMYFLKITSAESTSINRIVKQ